MSVPSTDGTPLSDGSSSTASIPLCRICHSSTPPKLLSPCACRGTCQHVHAACIEEWIMRRVRSGTPLHTAATCEICQTVYAHSISASHPLTFLASRGAWRRWAHLCYMAFVGRRMGYELGFVFRLLRRCLSAHTFKNNFALFGFTTPSTNSTNITSASHQSKDVVSRVSFSLLMATHYSLFLFLDARHLVGQYRRWRATTARIIVRNNTDDAT